MRSSMFMRSGISTSMSVPVRSSVAMGNGQSHGCLESWMTDPGSSVISSGTGMKPQRVWFMASVRPS